MFANALKVAPPRSALAGEPAPAARACARVRRGAMPRTSTPFLRAPRRAAGTRLPPALAGGWREAASILARKSKPYHAVVQSALRAAACRRFRSSTAREFPFLAELEAKTDVIRAELERRSQRARDRFAPYIQYEPGAARQPVARAQPLAALEHAAPLARRQARCQRTSSAARETAARARALPMADIDGLCPNAMFSALAPKTHIPPHNGETNARVVAHLPLIVPRRMLVSRRFRGAPLASRRGADLRRHDRARGAQRQRRAARRADLRPLESAATAAERDLVKSMAAAARDFNGIGNGAKN